MSSLVGQYRDIAALVRDFNECLLATLKDPYSFSYLNPKNAIALNFEMDGEYVDYFSVRTPEGQYYNMSCKTGLSTQEARVICEKYQIICML